MNIFVIILVALAIALFIFCILKIYVKVKIDIIDSASDIMPEIQVASICVLVISIYFLL